MNRALAHLRIKSYDEALKDVQPLIGRSHPPEKALYRASQALYHLDQYRKCSQVLEKLLQYYPENKVAIREVARVQRRLREQNFGQYDFGSMYNASKDEPLSLDNATYIGSVKVQESRGRGGGLFTTKNVAAGELLLCEKAFCYSYEQREGEEAEDPSKIVILANILTNRGTTGTQTHLMKNVIQKLKWNPSLLPSVSALHHGSYVPVQERYVDDGPIIDTYVFQHNTKMNAMSMLPCHSLRLCIFTIIAVALIALPNQAFIFTIFQRYQHTRPYTFFTGVIPSFVMSSSDPHLILVL